MFSALLYFPLQILLCHLPSDCMHPGNLERLQLCILRLHAPFTFPWFWCHLGHAYSTWLLKELGNNASRKELYYWKKQIWNEMTETLYFLNQRFKVLISRQEETEKRISKIII